VKDEQPSLFDETCHACGGEGFVITGIGNEEEVSRCPTCKGLGTVEVEL